MSQTIQKVFVSKNRTANVTCPKCKKSVIKDVAGFMGLDRAVRLKYTCPCGEAFPLLLERRTYVRKQVNLKGRLFGQAKDGGQQIVDMLVKDISRYGLKIKLLKKAELLVNQKVVIEFELDDKNKSLVNKEIKIRNFKPPHVGADFLTHEHYDKFGAYILFNFKDS